MCAGPSRPGAVRQRPRPSRRPAGARLDGVARVHAVSRDPPVGSERGRDGDEAADRGRAGRRERGAARGGEPLHRGDRGHGRHPERGADRRRDRRRRRGEARVGGHARRRARRGAARGGEPAARPRRRARPGDDRGGRQAADRELGRDRVDRRRVRLLRGDRARLGGAGDPVDRVDAAVDGGQGAGRHVRLHRAVELPAAAAVVEAGARARHRQHRGLQALGADPALHADAGLLLRAPAGRRDQHPGRAAATSARR